MLVTSTNTRSSSVPNLKSLDELPLELLQQTITYLRIPDVKSLRSCSRRLESATFEAFFSKAIFTFELSLIGMSDLAKLVSSEARRKVRYLSLIRPDFRRSGRVSIGVDKVDFGRHSATEDDGLKGLLKLEQFEALLQLMPSVSTLSIIDDFLALSWTESSIRNGSILPGIEALHVEVSRCESDSLCALLFKCKNVKELNIACASSKRAETTQSPMSEFMWSLGGFLDQNQTLTRLESLRFDGGRMQLTHLCSVLRSLRGILRIVELTEVSFVKGFIELDELFDEVEASEVLEALRIKANAMDSSEGMRNVLTRRDWELWENRQSRTFRNWLAGEREGASLHCWVEIRNSKRKEKSGQQAFYFNSVH